MAGKGHGGDEGSGTRSSLMWETVRIVGEITPKIVVWENVKGVLSKKHKHNFDAYQEKMKELGYTNFYKLMNARDYGIPQNRERVYTVSIRNDVYEKYFPNGFEFPKPEVLVKRLKDILEPSVDEKYYISSKQLAGMARTKFNSYKLDNLLRDKEGEAKTITARFEGCPQLVDQPQKNFVEKAYDEFINEKGYIPEKFNPYNKSEIEDVAPTQTTQCGSTTSSSTVLMNEGGYPVEHIKFTTEDDKTNEPYIVSSRGRDFEGEPKKVQRLEAHTDGVSNTLSTVQKDNWVAEPQAIKRRRTEYGKQVRKAYESGEIESNEKMRENYISNDGVMPTITASRREQKVATFEKMDTRNLKERLCDDLVEQGIVKGGEVINHSYTVENVPNVRIRKLTPKECWRLMNFPDEAFEKAEKVNSSAQLYKQAGNSIVVACLEKIFRNLLFDENGTFVLQ